MNHMYIRHTVGGRLFFDSKSHTAGYTIEFVDGRWKFIIDISDDNIVQQVLRYRNELNIFVVEAGEPKQKSWYYSKDGLAEYDKKKKQLMILADVKVDYAL